MHNIKILKSFLFSICMSCFTSIVFGVCIQTTFYNEMLLFVETQKCPKYFCEPMVCNKWTGGVLKVLILSLEWWILYIKKKECIILFHSNVTEGELNRQGPHLICETRNKALISNGWFYSAPFCLFPKLHVHIVLWSGEHVFSWRCVLSRPYLLMTLHPT